MTSSPAFEASRQARLGKIALLSSVHRAVDVRIFRKEAKTLLAAGHDVVVVAAHPRSEVVDGIRISAMPAALDRRQRMTTTLRALLRMALEEDADLYHFHDAELIPLGIRLKLAGKRVVYDVHENLPQQILSKTWIRPWLRGGVAGGAALAERIGGRLFDGIVAATPAIARRFPPRKTITVQNFPFAAEFTQADCAPYRTRRPLIAYVGGITAVRGIREMVEAISLLPEALGVRLVIAGTFLEPRLEALCRALPGWDRVDLLGWQERSEVAALLGEARAGLVVLHPIVNYLDAYPVKLFEYMAAGLPVVASDFPLWRGIVEGADCGLLVDPRDPDAIAQGLHWLLQHPQEAEAMGQRGREAVLSRYNWDAEAPKLLNLYQRLLSS